MGRISLPSWRHSNCQLRSTGHCDRVCHSPEATPSSRNYPCAFRLLGRVMGLVEKRPSDAFRSSMAMELESVQGSGSGTAGSGKWRVTSHRMGWVGFSRGWRHRRVISSLLRTIRLRSQQETMRQAGLAASLAKFPEYTVSKKIGTPSCSIRIGIGTTADKAGAAGAVGIIAVETYCICSNNPLHGPTPSSTSNSRKLAMQVGWTAAAGHSLPGRGKSELRRAVCRITSGTGASRRRDG